MAHISSLRGWLCLLGLALVLGACTNGSGSGPAEERRYLGVETRLLDNDLVNVQVAMRGARDRHEVTVYAECAAAQYTLIRGFGFARHVRSNVVETDGLWQADSVYIVSAALPQGLQTIDAEVVLANCQEIGVPTI